MIDLGMLQKLVKQLYTQPINLKNIIIDFFKFRLKYSNRAVSLL